MDILTPKLGLFFWQLVVFSLSVLVLSLTVWTPIIDFLQKEEDIFEKEKANLVAEKLESKKVLQKSSQIIENSEKKAEGIVLSAKDESRIILERGKEEAEQLRDKILSKAKEQIDMERKKLIRELQREMNQLIVLATEKILRRRLGEDEIQNLLISQTVKDISKYGNCWGNNLSSETQ